jgi:glycosyltransferase involved in cell wall biosynthesis
MCGLDNNVFAPGYVYDVDSFYKIADIVMLTSVNEPCGFTILEAMKTCKPVVAFDSGGPAELLKNDYSGILVPVGKTRLFAEQIEVLLGDAQRCTLLGKNAIQEIKLNFSKSHWKHEMFSVFYSIILGKEYAEKYE